MLKKILYADSGADNAQDMLKILLQLPSLKDVELSILRVISPKTKEEEQEGIGDAEAKVQQLISKLSIEAKQVATLVKEGEAKTTVLNTAKDIDADLIIMGSRALGRLQSILSNSVSQYVFQLTDRSMLLVKDDIYIKRLKRVMVALDKSAAAQYALDLAIFLLQGYTDAEIFLTRINTDLSPDASLSKEEMENDSVLASAAAKVKRMGLGYRCIVKGGKPAQQICALVAENNIDLLLLGSPERRPSIAKNLPDLDRLLGQSLSDYVRVKAECPVLLARQEEG